MKTASGKHPCVAHQINTKRARQATENRAKLCSVVETILFCGRQEIALRGKVDSGQVMEQDIGVNDGNFCALLRFRAESGDFVLH